ncbi:hypothetical protein FGG08_006243 [Glutinoglossum americanum]|uniref:MICOS complex subunit n=1 Tax=Glutinoglossum americanum TaxID=1670608 RepID=A0A9P8I1W9_9PEZI|nr:hypothetical protein FGG08_006243 [Glutinoglossum americanum]
MLCWNSIGVVSPQSFNKKPIYDDFRENPTSNPTNSRSSGPEPATPRRPTPTDRLAAQIRVARLSLHSQAARAEDSFNGFMSRLLDIESNFTNTVASLAPPKESGEKLLPGVLYTLVSSMAGSIVARNRNILVRGIFPVAVGVGAGWVFLPITMRNVGDLVWRWEEKVPAISETHLRVRNSTEHAWHMTKTHWDLGVNRISEFVSDGREKVQEWVRKGK